MKRILSEQLKTGMITAEDIYALNGQLLIPKGISLTETMIETLQFYSIRSIRIDDTAKPSPIAAAAANDDIYLGKNLNGFVSKFPEESRKARIHEIKEFKEDYQKGLNYFQVAINNLVAKNTTLDVNTILNQTMALLSSRQRHSNILEMLVYMKELDTNVYAHSINVSLLCNMLARWLEYSEEDCRMAAACGMFHDIGKLAIPEEIILKPGPLTPEERELASSHAEKGYHILSSYNVDETVKLSALMHHEKCDGSGYPHNLKGSQIDKFAKLVTICDIYNAMTSDRPYRKAMSPFSVIDHFEAEGLRKFDTRSILLFMENTASTYVNTPVRLSDGRVGYVVFINRCRLGRPTVQCGSDFIDLSKEKSLSITELLPVV